MRTTFMNPFEDDAVNFLAWAYGEKAREAFMDNLSNDQRVGQAFMSVLYSFDQPEYDRLASSIIDPFYNDARIPAALDRITSK